MPTLTRIKIPFYLTIITSLLLITGCSDDDEPAVLTSATYEASFNINPATFPKGGGIDLSAGDSGIVAQLDTDAIEWDIQIKAIRTGAGGRPGVFLFGDDQSAEAVRAVNVSELSSLETGSSGFEAFERVSAEMLSALAADGVFTFDPETDLDSEGVPDAEALASAYQDLVIGDRIVNLEEADQPVYLVEDRGGSFYKFQMVSREGGGGATIRWAKFTSDAID